MNKTELVSFIAEKSEGILTKKQAELAVNLFEYAVEEALRNGDKLQLVGFMSIEPVGRNARKGRNPQTGEEIEIPAKMDVKIKAGKRLEKAVEGLNVNDFLK